LLDTTKQVLQELRKQTDLLKRDPGGKGGVNFGGGSR
jgi:hypothetical protein